MPSLRTFWTLLLGTFLVNLWTFFFPNWLFCFGGRGIFATKQGGGCWVPRPFWIKPLELMKDPLSIGTTDDPLWKSPIFFLTGMVTYDGLWRNRFFLLFVFWPFSWKLISCVNFCHEEKSPHINQPLGFFLFQAAKRQILRLWGFG